MVSITSAYGSLSHWSETQSSAPVPFSPNRSQAVVTWLKAPNFYLITWLVFLAQQSLPSYLISIRVPH